MAIFLINVRRQKYSILTSPKTYLLIIYNIFQSYKNEGFDLGFQSLLIININDRIVEMKIGFLQFKNPQLILRGEVI